MQIVDYKEKMKIINDFYEQACEVRDMVHDSIRGFHYIHNYDLLSDDDPSKKLSFEMDFSDKVAKRKKQLLIELGRVGEYSLKYILLLKQMNAYPNQSIKEFKEKAIYNLGSKGVRNTYINQYHIDGNKIDKILEEGEKHKLQPLHDYSYLYEIIKYLYPEIVDKIHKFMLLEIKSNCSEDSKFIDQNSGKIISLFPQIDFMPSLAINDAEKDLYKAEYDRIINESGDSFIKLRYVENNPDDKKYDLISILNVLDYLVDFVEIVKIIDSDNLEKEIGVSFVKAKFYELSITKSSKGVSPLEYNTLGMINLERERNTINEVFNILESNPNILEGIDYSQISIYKALSQKELTVSEVYDNFLNNINNNKQSISLLNILPLLLDSNNTNKILSILSSNGVNIEKLDDSYKKVLCFPFEFFQRVLDAMKESGECLINNDGSLNRKIYNIAEKIRLIDEKKRQEDGLPPLPLRNR